MVLQLQNFRIMVSERFCLHLHANAARLFWSLFREYENLKEARKVSGEMTEKLKKELFAANSKVQGECGSHKAGTWSVAPTQ